MCDVYTLFTTVCVEGRAPRLLLQCIPRCCSTAIARILHCTLEVRAVMTPAAAALHGSALAAALSTADPAAGCCCLCLLFFPAGWNQSLSLCLETSAVSPPPHTRTHAVALGHGWCGFAWTESCRRRVLSLAPAVCTCCSRAIIARLRRWIRQRCGRRGAAALVTTCLLPAALFVLPSPCPPVSKLEQRASKMDRGGTFVWASGHRGGEGEGEGAMTMQRSSTGRGKASLHFHTPYLLPLSPLDIQAAPPPSPLLSKSMSNFLTATLPRHDDQLLGKAGHGRRAALKRRHRGTHARKDEAMDR